MSKYGMVTRYNMVEAINNGNEVIVTLFASVTLTKNSYLP